MEALFIFIAKSAGLVALFYLSYYFLLRKETFFNSNRWFLLAGLFTSVALPLLVYTKIVWVDHTPISNMNFTPITIPQVVEKIEPEFNWNFIYIGVYLLGLLGFLIKFAFDFYSLHSILKNKKIQQQADFKFIDVTESIAPFSYFEYIVYNSSMFSETELESIIEHEKVHSEQNHTVDVLISRIFCVLFWFNPIIWLYKKAIVQNLEFIADNVAAQKISDKKAYQYTLLKITTHESCLSITNHFYQSLIKKRIVMLNKNQSKKRNSWKFCTVIPALVAFVLLFQVETIAQEKTTSKKMEEIKPDEIKSMDVFSINKNTTEAALEKHAKTLKEKFDIAVTTSELKRNSKDEITSIQIELKDKNGVNKVKKAVSSNGIDKIGIIVINEKNGATSFNFTGDEPIVNNSKKGDNNNIKIEIKNTQTSNINKDAKVNSTVNTNVSTNVNTNISTTTNVNSSSTTVTADANSIRISSNPEGNIKPLIVINGTVTPNIDVKDIDANTIISVNVLKGSNAVAKYKVGESDSVIEIETKSSSKK